jgi:hypothetical protein
MAKVFVFGALAYVFAAFVPGYIFLRLSPVKGELPPFSGPFAFSIIINFLLVMILAGLGLYTQPVVLSVTAIGTISATLLLITDRRLEISCLISPLAHLFRTIAELLDERRYVTLVAGTVSTIAAIVTTVVVSSRIAPRLASLFIDYDAILVWNHWAVNWAGNHFPLHIYHYPQAIPALWSIPYVAMGTTEIAYFSTSFKILFWLGTFETLIFLSVRRRNPVLLSSVWAIASLFLYQIGFTSLGDLIDVPIAFMALLAATPILAAREGSLESRIIWLALMLASGAAMTKQVGGYMLVAVPALIFLHENAPWDIVANLRTARRLMLPFLVAVLWASPIYVYAEYTRIAGTNTSEIGYLFDDIFEGKTRIERAVEAFGALLQAQGTLFGPLFFAICLIALADRLGRCLLLCVAIPFTLLWATNFSYDGRNLALSMPFWGISFGLGLTVLTAQGDRLLLSLQSVADKHPYSVALLNRYSLVALLLVAVAVGLSLDQRKRSERYLLARQERLEIEELGGNPTINRLLAKTIASLDRPYGIISEWRFTCTYSWVKDAKSCTVYREETEQFLRDRGHRLLEDHSQDWLVIVDQKSMTQPVTKFLEAEELHQVAIADEFEHLIFFVRHKGALGASSEAE